MSGRDEAAASASWRPPLSGLLSGSADFLRRRFVAVLVIATVANLPDYFSYTLLDLAPPESQGVQDIFIVIGECLLGNVMENVARFPIRLGWLHGLLSLFGWVVTLGCVTHLIMRERQGETAGVGEALRATMRRGGPLAGVGLVVDLLPALLGPFLLIPGYFVLCAMLVAVPVCVTEGRNVRESLSRSFALTRGYRLHAFAIVILVTVFIGSLRIVDALAPDLGAETRNLVGNAWFALAFAVGAVLIGTYYRLLRAVKDPPEGESIARVFE